MSEPLPPFYRALQRFVDREQDTQNAQIRETWDKPLAERVQLGEAIGDVRIVARRGSYLVVEWRENLSKFRVGDTVILHRGNPHRRHLQMTIEEEDRDSFVLKAGYGVYLDAEMGILRRSDGWILDRAVVDVRHLQKGAIEELAFRPHHPAAHILEHGDAPVAFDRKQLFQAMQYAQQVGMNKSQIEAFARAAAADPLYLIQGPPGTGKTWVLAHLAYVLAYQGQKVLVTAFTHRAINNALLKIAEVTRYPYVYKVGQPHRARELAGRVENLTRMSSADVVTRRAPNGGLIVGGTCFAVRTKRLNEVHFDTVIFDEASQITLPLAIAGMLAGDRYVFVGDHQQMPPVVVADHRPAWVAQSAFERLVARYPVTMLDITYRMNKEINAFPSRAFYDGRLRPHPQVADRRLAFSQPPQQYAAILDPAVPDVFVAVPHTRRSVRSPEEADLAAALIAEAVASGVPPGEIAVVVPYRAQARLIRNRLAALSHDGYHDRIVVDTVERIQGQEREMILVSLTTSDPGHAAMQAEFFFQPNRLNVAITRARTKRIVLGSPLLFQATATDPRLQQWIALFERLYRSSTVVRIGERQDG